LADNTLNKRADVAFVCFFNNKKKAHEKGELRTGETHDMVSVHVCHKAFCYVFESNFI